MNFLNLHAENFMALSHVDLNLKDRGLLLIQGDNRDDPSANSNGAGKSSIADAICWVIYGKTARGVSGDSVINRVEGKGTRVSLTVEDGEQAYQITRHRKHKTGKNQLWVTDIACNPGKDLTLGTDKLTQDLVDRIVGCSYEVFTAAIYAGQEAMPDLPSMTDKQLKTIVEEAAGVNRLQDAYALARQKLTDQNREVDWTTLKSATLRDQVDSHKADVESLKAHIKKWEDEQAKKELDGLSRLQAIEIECGNKKRELSSYDLKSIDTKLADLEAKLLGRKDEEAAVVSAKMALVKLEGMRDKIKDRMFEKADKIKAMRAQRENIESIVGTPCSECGKTYSHDDLDEARRLNDETVSVLMKEVRDYKEQFTNAADAVEIARLDVERLSNSLTNVDEVVSLQRVLRSEKQHAERLSAELDALDRQAHMLHGDIKLWAAETNPYIDMMTEKAKKLSIAETELTGVEGALDELGKQLSVLNETVETFCPAGVRAHIIDTVTPMLNKQTAHYLMMLADGHLTAVWNTLSTTAKGELRERFAIDVSSTTGADSFAGLSGGEKRKVRLACALALQDLVASRASKSINLWIGDEIDHALDASGLERLMNVLESKARERGTVLVVSHNSLTDWIREVIVVKKEDGKSIVE